MDDFHNFIMSDNPEKSQRLIKQQPELELDEKYYNQLNNSTSKQLYSLAKEPRWKEQKKYNCLDAESPTNLTCTNCPR